jgi:hypothetical protein
MSEVARLAAVDDGDRSFSHEEHQELVARLVELQRGSSTTGLGS